jgi:hypothetical protein
MLKNSIEIPIFTHQSTYLYQKALQESEITETEDFIQLFIAQTFIDVTLKKEGQLRLINRFNWATDEDICYYLFNILKQFELDNRTCKLLLYDEQGKYIERMSKALQGYFRRVKGCKI